MHGVAKEVIRVEDFDSDAVLLQLASRPNVKKFVSLDTPDIGKFDSDCDINCFHETLKIYNQFTNYNVERKSIIQM